MKKTTRCRLGGALFVALAAAACGSDTTAPDQNQLDSQASMEITAELLEIVLEVGLGSLADFAPGQSLQVAADDLGPSFNTTTIEVTAPCDLGGSVAVAGSFTDDVDETTGSGSVSFQLTQNPNNCEVDTTHGVFVVNGSPHLTVGADMTVADGWPGMIQMTLVGGYSWSGPPGSGSCTMDFSMSLDFANPEHATLTGTACGHPL